MAMKLYVGGLAYSVTEDQLQTLFAEHGEVVSTAIIKDRDSGQSKGFGFVEMKNNSEAEAAIAALNNKEVSGRTIMVNQARPQENRSSFGGGSRSGGGNGGGYGGGFRNSSPRSRY